MLSNRPRYPKLYTFSLSDKFTHRKHFVSLRKCMISPLSKQYRTEANKQLKKTLEKSIYPTSAI